MIVSPGTLLELDVIDWRRGGIYWDDPQEALATISAVIVGRTEYLIAEVDMRLAPERGDWPDWRHTGAYHNSLGKLWWDWFHWKRKGTLSFSDSPDFQGTLQLPNQAPIRFWGDIGTVSALAFFESIRQMKAGDLWISIPDHETQVLLSPLVDLNRLLGQSINDLYEQ